MVLVATSNVAPDDLYRDGLNRPLFLPFIGMLERHAEVFALDAGKDYRLEKLSRHAGLHHAGRCRRRPPDGRGLAGDDAWPAAPGRDGAAVKGRQVVRAGAPAGERGAVLLRRSLRKAARRARLSWRSPAAIDTIFIDHIPVLAEGRRNEAKRLILLIDTLYDHHMRLVASAEAPPAELYAGRHGRRSVRVRAHRLAADRDAGPGLAGRLGGAAQRGGPAKKPKGRHGEFAATA